MHRSRPLRFALATLATALALRATPAAGQAISFSGAAWYPVGSNPNDVALGDYDGDGILDAATADIAADCLTVRRGDGIGGFGPPLTVPVGDAPWRLASGRVNADSFADLVVSHASADGTWLLLADGLGGFAASTQIAGDARTVPALADLDGDNDSDLALANSAVGTYLVLRLSDANGGFGAPTSLQGYSEPMQLEVADFNGDSKPDLVLLARSGLMLAYPGDGTGSVAPPIFSNSGLGACFDLVAAHMNGDQHLDLAVTSSGSQYLAVVLGDGTGSFSYSPSSFTRLDRNVFGIASGDWNGDGLTDLAVATEDQRQRLLLGDGAGGITAVPVAEEPPVPCLGYKLERSDLDSDGHGDLLCVDNSASRLVVSLGNGAGAFTAGRTFPAGDQPRSLAIAPFDAAAGPDLLVGSYATGGGFRLLPSTGSGLFGPATVFTPAGAEHLIGVAVDDLDGDDDADAVFIANNSMVQPRLEVALGDGVGGFPGWSVQALSMGASGVGLGRFDGDPWPDVVLQAWQYTNGVALFPGDGAGGFGASTFYSSPGENARIGLAIADLDGDLDLDVAHPNGLGASFTVRFGDGAGALGDGTVYPLTGTCNYVAAGDLDGDLDLDLVAAGDRLSLLLQGTAGSFSLHQEIVPDFLIYQVALADFDGDGDLDIATVGNGSGTLVYANDGNGAFAAPIRFGSWGMAFNLRASDLDGDGLADLVATHYDFDNVIVLRNNARRMADLAVTIENGRTSGVPGEAVSYTVTASNLGPALVHELTLAVLDTPSLVGRTFLASAGSYTPATGSWTGLELRHGESVTLSVDGTVDPWTTGAEVVTCIVVAPPEVSDPAAANDTASDSDALTPRTDLALTKSDGETNAVAGLPIVYTLAVTNHGPSAVPSLTLLDPPPVALLSAVFTPQRGAYDAGTGTWSGALIGPGETVTLELAATVDPGAPGDLLVNTATLAPPAGTIDPQTLNDRATDVDALRRVADLALGAGDGRSTVAPGEAVVYTVTLANNGPSRVDGVTLVESLPAALLSVSHTPANGSYAPSTGEWTGLALDPGDNTSMTIGGTVDLAASGTLSYSAVVFAPLGTHDPVVANNVAADHEPIAPAVDLAVIKSDGREGVWPGETLVYAIAVTNAGPSHVLGATVADTFSPTTLSGCSWTCAATGGGASCPAGPVVGDIAAFVDLPAGASVLFTATCTATAAVTNEPVVNTATAAPPAGVTERDPSDNTATDLTRPAALFGDSFESGGLGDWSGGVG